MSHPFAGNTHIPMFSVCLGGEGISARGSETLPWEAYGFKGREANSGQACYQPAKVDPGQATPHYSTPLSHLSWFPPASQVSVTVWSENCRFSGNAFWTIRRQKRGRFVDWPLCGNVCRTLSDKILTLKWFFGNLQSPFLTCLKMIKSVSLLAVSWHIGELASYLWNNQNCRYIALYGFAFLVHFLTTVTTNAVRIQYFWLWYEVV